MEACPIARTVAPELVALRQVEASPIAGTAALELRRQVAGLAELVTLRQVTRPQVAGTAAPELVELRQAAVTPVAGGLASRLPGR